MSASDGPPPGSPFKAWPDLGPRENWPVGSHARRFRATDFVNRVSILCPHCDQMLEVKEAEGPFVGWNPERGLDRFWVFTLADGENARFWEDGKGVLEP